MKYKDNFQYSWIDLLERRPKPIEQIVAEQTEEIHKIRQLLEIIVEKLTEGGKC